ncbi:MAG: acetylglutamate kinase [Rhodospirillaceae bacterium]|nr:acetylglutamate kinase [Rhodospirillaceae bacterium]
MKEFNGNTFVIKFGGNAMGDAEMTQSFSQNIVLMKQVGINPIVVHGGGPQIGNMLKKLDIETNFVDGLRVTDKTTVEIVEMVLCGKINKEIVQSINNAGGTAVGISGKDSKLINAKRLTKKNYETDSSIEKILDLGYVGEPNSINPYILNIFEKSDIIPVIAPIGIGDDGQTYNINADTVAGAIASAIKATKLIILTDVKGVLDEKGILIEEIDINFARDLMSRNIFSEGMIPKIETCVSALNSGTEAVHILDGRIKNAMILEVFTEKGIGTKMVP